MTLVCVTEKLDTAKQRKFSAALTRVHISRVSHHLCTPLTHVQVSFSFPERSAARAYTNTRARRVAHTHTPSLTTPPASNPFAPRSHPQVLPSSALPAQKQTGAAQQPTEEVEGRSSSQREAEEGGGRRSEGRAGQRDHCSPHMPKGARAVEQAAPQPEASCPVGASEHQSQEREGETGNAAESRSKGDEEGSQRGERKL